MALPGRPLTFRPFGCCDAVDGSNAPQGAMRNLQNLVPDPRTNGVFVPRPAATEIVGVFPHSNPGAFISGELVVGDIAYGMIASNRFAGKDEPYAYNLATRNFLTVNGVVSAGLPASPASSGAWTPPYLTQVGGRVIVTHPGFPGGATKFGWLDVSGASVSVTGNTHSNTTVDGDPAITGIQPGMTVSGSGIAAGTTVVLTKNFVDATTGTTTTPFTISNFATTIPAAVGQTIAGTGIPANTTIVQIVNVSTLVMSHAATAAGTGVALTQSFQTTGSTQNSTTLYGVYNVSGISVGMVVASSGGDIPMGTTVTAVNQNGTVTISQAATGSNVNDTLTFTATGATGNLALGTIITNVANVTGVTFGQQVAGLGIPAGTTVLSVTGSNVGISNAATIAATSAITFTGAVIVLSQNAAATANGVALTVAGGTMTAPLWGSGDTDQNNLPAVPVGVAQMNGRAYYACGASGIVFSDPLFPCRVSNTTATQALTTNDGLAVTAIAPLMLSSPLLTNGIVQGLIVFQGGAKMQQITGDQVFGNLSMNAMPVATGTLAPLSIFGSELGTGFVSPEGLRFIKFDGTVSEPVGDAGSGITVPFIQSMQPSRMCAAANAKTVRISTQNGDLAAAPQQEWWYDLARKVWTGPHNNPASLIQPWRSTFVEAPILAAGALFQSDAFPSPGSTYVENDQPLSWLYTPTPLPDTDAVAQNSCVEMTVAAQLPIGSTIAVNAYDIGGRGLDATTVAEPFSNSWGPGFPGWDRQYTSFQQLAVNWHVELNFKQLVLNLSGPSAHDTRIGNIYMRINPLGYKLMAA